MGADAHLRWIAADLQPGRFFEGPDVVRRIAPFVAAGALPLALVPLVGASFAQWQVLTAVALVPVLVGTIILAPWERLPAWAQSLVPYGYFAIPALLGSAASSDEAGVFAPLVAVPVAWFALYGTRNQLIGAYVLTAAALAGPILGSRHLAGTAAALIIAIPLIGRVQALVSALRDDHRERRRAEAALLEAETRFRRAFEDIRVGMAITSNDGRFVRVNKALADITGYSIGDLVGKRFSEITHPDDRDSDIDALVEIAEGDRYSYRTDKRYVRADGSDVWVALNVSPIHDENGDVIHMISQMEDITERKAAEERLTHQALHDPLTALPNRILFADRVRMASARRDSGHFAVIYLDLDTFKPINDTLGHAAGDTVLIEVARRLEEVLRDGDTLARLGGDEFAILCESLKAGEARAIAERVIDAFSPPFEIDGHSIRQAASIGVAVRPRTGRAADPEEVLRDADHAMYRAKAAGKSRFALYERWMGGEAESKGLEVELRTALDKGELRVHYQPEVDLSTGAVTGAEALVRWEHPTRGLLAPTDFMFVAEATGLIAEIDDFVMRRACHQAAEWLEALDDTADFSVSVNLSERRLADPDLSGLIAQAISDAQLPPSCLCLEVAERTILDRRGDALRAIPHIESLGVRLLIDDFGIAVSSFSALKRLPRLNAIKIDSSFTAGLGHSREDSAGVAAIIGLAHGLRVTATAEGVETAEQTAELRRLSCDRAQGFHFARPQPAGAFSELLESSRYGELLA